MTKNLPPQHPGQADTLTICRGAGVDIAEVGHWYSPNAVRKLLDVSLPLSDHSGAECFAAFEWLRIEATKEGADPRAGIILDELHALSVFVKQGCR